MHADAEGTTVVPTTPEGVVAAIVALVPVSDARTRLCIDAAPAARPEELGERVVADAREHEA